jgi:hypothetical protein
MRRGARGIVLKQSASDLLVKSIRRVYSGEIWLDNRITAEVMKAFAKVSNGGSRRDKPLLSEREKQIVSLVAQGNRNKEIGANLFISEQTVKYSAGFRDSIAIVGPIQEHQFPKYGKSVYKLDYRSENEISIACLNGAHPTSRKMVGDVMVMSCGEEAKSK